MSNKGKPKVALDPKEVRNVIDGLKNIYKSKVLPVEELYKYADFHSPTLLDSDIESKPMVLLVGQYSTGKTTFIRYLVGRDFPGAHIGPEPTTGNDGGRERGGRGGGRAGERAQAGAGGREGARCGRKRPNHGSEGVGGTAQTARERTHTMTRPVRRP